MSRRNENTGFVCAHCGEAVKALTNGSYRNHCPFCLHSRHVDEMPGDRAADCGGVMEPVELRHKPGKGLQIRFRCLECGAESFNRVATDTVQPDDMTRLAPRLPL
ncbi:RNHCP domain-containing protein [Stackebrandtia soli]|uniref:RNHCP domain-containing protein n=1 Tax=Stackebrandtia soli TaxID=1892856 RepID=UPI0039E81F70